MRAIILMLMLSPLLAFAEQIDTVEPPSWWIGMDNTKLQLLIHGKGIGQLRPALEYPGVEIVTVHNTESRNYLILDLRIAPNAVAGEIPLRFYRDKTLAVQWQYPLHNRVEHSAERQGFSGKDTIYLITPDRFANGDTSNDGYTVKGLADPVKRATPKARHGGDLTGIIKHLDYISDMGFTQLLLNPVLENAQADNSFLGYAITDFYRLDPRLGSNAQYLALSQNAKQRGLGLIMELVLNHCGSQHRWMHDAPFSDWINFDDNFSATTDRHTTLRDPHAALSDARQFTDGWLSAAMPDLNQRNKFLAEYLIQNTLWWIEYAGLTGVRVSRYEYADKTFLAAWGKRIMAEYPNFNIVGEERSTSPAVISYWQTDKQNSDGYQPQLKSLMDYPLQASLVDALKNQQGAGMTDLYEALSRDFLYPDPDNMVVFADNHNLSRVYTQLDESDAHWRQAMVYLLTTRGIPQLYYGTEILLSNPNSIDYGAIASDFPGGWSDDTSNGFTAKGLSKNAAQAQKFLRRLLNWRKNSEAITQGRLIHYAPEDDVYVFFNVAEKSQIMTILNHSPEARELPLDRFSDILIGTEKALDVIDNKAVVLTDVISLSPMSARVIELTL